MSSRHSDTVARLAAIPSAVGVSAQPVVARSGSPQWIRTRIASARGASVERRQTGTTAAAVSAFLARLRPDLRGAIEMFRIEPG